MSIARKKTLLVYNTNLTGNLKPNAYNIYNHIDKWYRKIIKKSIDKKNLLDIIKQTNV